MRAVKATVFGLFAGLAGAAIWYAVRIMTEHEIGLIAIVVGLMVGGAVRKGSGARGGWFYQTLAIALTYLCISAQYMPDIVQGIYEQADSPESAKSLAAKDGRTGKSAENRLVADRHDKSAANKSVESKSARKKIVAEDALAEDKANQVSGNAAPQLGAIGVSLLLLVALAVALAVPVFGNPIGLLIIGVALYEAWKMNKRPSVQIAGPFQLATPLAPGAQGV